MISAQRTAMVDLLENSQKIGRDTSIGSGGIQVTKLATDKLYDIQFREQLRKADRICEAALTQSPSASKPIGIPTAYLAICDPPDAGVDTGSGSGNPLDGAIVDTGSGSGDPLNGAIADAAGSANRSVSSATKDFTPPSCAALVF